MKLAVAFIVLVSLTGLAAAEPGPADPYAGPPRTERRTQRKAERRAEMLQRFDQNGDGRLEPRERRIARRELRRAHKIQKLIHRYDLNHDGIVDRSELPPRLVPRLQKLDRNGDGWVDDADVGAPRRR
jgi:Ca2+-binding EF-hand superfamily protein